LARRKRNARDPEPKMSDGVRRLCTKVHYWLMVLFRRVMLGHSDHVCWMRVWIRARRRIHELLRVRIPRRQLGRRGHAVVRRRVVRRPMRRPDGMRAGRRPVVACWVRIVGRVLGGVGVHHLHHRWRGEEGLWCYGAGGPRIARLGLGRIHGGRSRDGHGRQGVLRGGRTRIGRRRGVDVETGMATS
jgi:hypothetical protein